MPELPEVETIKRGLNRKAKGKKIKKLWTDHAKMVKGLSFSQLEREIKNTRIVKISRRAKNLLLELSNGNSLWIHLKMTGHLLFKSKNPTLKELEFLEKDKFNAYIHFTFYFNDGSQLDFSDLRKFGRIKLIKAKINEILKHPDKYGLAKIGQEPLLKKFSSQKLQEILNGNNRVIKIVLMDQSLIAGIGNIYASEILFNAKINPRRRAETIKQDEVKRLHRSMVNLLTKAIKFKGTSVNDYRSLSGEKGNFQKMLKVYQKTGKKCHRCGKIIKRIKQGQRSTFYCSHCQR
ncbi:MAG: bifunctional DNA-formamidopyrimidine glycosylase/DNA-(apurinic or apyrimidinic site) lyase [Patescibacteria group bacterium]|nr:bifunctional DNA-formamidopyrimidine glycosylase/DNA-(apurinic or apyrimidinic site) lyase [Patescibacteria group bacterium]